MPYATKEMNEYIKKRYKDDPHFRERVLFYNRVSALRVVANNIKSMLVMGEVKVHGNSGRINTPKDWIGKCVIVLRKDFFTTNVHHKSSLSIANTVKNMLFLDEVVKAQGNSGRINTPKGWRGKRVVVLREDFFSGKIRADRGAEFLELDEVINELCK